MSKSKRIWLSAVLEIRRFHGYYPQRNVDPVPHFFVSVLLKNKQHWYETCLFDDPTFSGVAVWLLSTLVSCFWGCSSESACNLPATKVWAMAHRPETTPDLPVQSNLLVEYPLHRRIPGSMTGSSSDQRYSSIVWFSVQVAHVESGFDILASTCIYYIAKCIPDTGK